MDPVRAAYGGGSCRRVVLEKEAEHGAGRRFYNSAGQAKSIDSMMKHGYTPSGPICSTARTRENFFGDIFIQLHFLDSDQDLFCPFLYPVLLLPVTTVVGIDSLAC